MSFVKNNSLFSVLFRFSPDGKKFAVTKDDAVLIYYAPGKTREINPFTLHRKYTGAYGKTRCIDWTSDSK